MTGASAMPAMATTAAAADRSEVGLYRYMQECDNPRMSMTFSHTKGLLNAPGQNNCFLNSAVQVFWHLDVFRRNFRHLSGHACMGHSCIFCALKVIFTQFQHSDKGAQPPDPLRRALAHTFADQQRFQLGYMDDAAECFENILLRIHTHIAPDEKEDQCRAKHCIPHQKFSLAITEQVGCRCGAVSEPFSYNEMVFYVSTSALVTEAMASYQANPSSWGNFARLLKDTVAKGDTRSCPRNCGARCEKKRILTNHPDVVSIGLVWDSAKSGADHIQDVVGCIGTTLRLQELFHNSTTPEAIKHSTVLNLVGVVCYYGKHYSTFFFHSKVEEWIYFDDASVKQVSPNWEDVVDRIVRGRHQPLLLLYMNPRSQLLSIDTAPQYTEMVPGYEWNEASAQAEAISAVGLRSGDDTSSRASSSSLASLPPPPPGFDESIDSSSTASSTTPVLGSASKRLPLQQTSSDPRVATGSWAPAYAPKNSIYDLRQQDDRDSGADEGSYTDLDRQSSLVSTDDTASSYSSRASGSSSSYVGERDQCGHRGSYGRALSMPASSAAPAAAGDRAKDAACPQQDKVRMRKKKSRTSGQSGTGSALSSGGALSSSSRCLSAVSLTSADSAEDGSSVKTSGRDSGLEAAALSGGSNPPGYATLPRKKKVKSIAATDDLSRHVDWIKEVAKKSEQLQPATAAAATTSAPSSAAVQCLDVRDRIRQFSALGSGATGSSSVAAVAAPAATTNLHGAAATIAAPAATRSAIGQVGSSVFKPSPLYGDNSSASPPHEGYIDRNSVERLIRQQRSATAASASPSKERAGSATTATALACDLSALRVTVAAAGDPLSTKAAIAMWREDSGRGSCSSSSGVGDVLTSDVGSLKDSGYRSGSTGGGGDRTSLSSAGSGSLFSSASPSSQRAYNSGPTQALNASGRHWGATPSWATAEERGNGDSLGFVGVSAVNGSGIANGAMAEDDEDFPPPPSEQELCHIGTGCHSKQASQGSLSSETSTLRNSGATRADDSGGDDDVDDDSRSSSGAPTSGRPLLGGGRVAELQPRVGIDVCDSAAAPSAGLRSGGGPWTSAAIQLEQPVPVGLSRGGTASLAPPHQMLARAHSLGPEAPADMCEKRANSAASLEKSSFQFPPRTIYNTNGGVAAYSGNRVAAASHATGSAASVPASNGVEQPLTGDSGLARQYPPLRSPAADQAARTSSSALPTRQGPGSTPAATTRASEPPATSRVPSSALPSSQLAAGATTAMDGTQKAAGPASQPSTDGHSPAAAPIVQPPWQQQLPNHQQPQHQLPQHLQQPLPTAEEPRGWPRPVVQRSSSCSSERGSTGAVQAQQPAAAAASAVTAQSHLAGGRAVLPYGQHPGAGQAGALTSTPGSSGPAAAQAAASAAVIGHSAAGGSSSSPAGQLPPPPLRLYGEQQQMGTLAAAGGRHRDSYAQSLGSVAAELYGRGNMMLPPKARRAADTASSGGMSLAAPVPSPQPALQVASGQPNVSRSAYELGFSHYDRLPRSQQQQQRSGPVVHGDSAGLGMAVDSRSELPAAAAIVGATVPRPAQNGAASAVGARAQVLGNGSSQATWQQQQPATACGTGPSQQCAPAAAATGRPTTSVAACGASAMPYQQQQARPLPQQSYGSRPPANGDQGRSAAHGPPLAAGGGYQSQQQQLCAQPVTPPWQQQQRNNGRDAPWENSTGGCSDGRPAPVSSQLSHREAGSPISPAAISQPAPWQRQPAASSRALQPQPTSGVLIRAPPAGPAVPQWDGL